MVEATYNKLLRPMTASGRPAHEGAKVTHDYMRDDIRQNLPERIQYIDQEETDSQVNKRGGKFEAFKEWLLANGAVFDDSIQYPAFFEGGLEGLAAKQAIGAYEAYIFIPNTIIISVERVKASAELRPVIADNFQLFGDIHPDRWQLSLRER